jgi:hypothetical protein
MATVDLPVNYRRGTPEPIDVSYVFNSVADLEAYLESSAYLNPPYAGLGAPYSGQIMAVLNGTSQPDVYTIWEVPSGTAGAMENQLSGQFFAYGPVSGGGGGAMPEPLDDGQLYGRTRAPSTTTGTWNVVADDGQY